jgi:hypothetical protein
MSTTIEQNKQLAELQREVHELRRELAILRPAKQGFNGDDADALPRGLKQLIEMTNELVPGELRIENSVDPDYPETVCVVFRVIANEKLNDVNAIIDTEIEWHRRARSIYPEATCYFRLAIDH